MITLPRACAPVFATCAATLLVLASTTAAQGTPAVPTVPSSIGPISAGDAMPHTGEARVTATCYTSGQPGGPISQATVLARAAVWVQQNVPYTGACAQEPGGNYRLDCSGFVSMTWGLSTSLSTYDFNPAINGGDARFAVISRANLQPGDAVVADNSLAHHIALFTGWDVNDNGQHRYANLSEESDFNVGTIAVAHQDLLGSYWGTFTPIRYTNVIHSLQTGASAVLVNGVYHVAWLNGAGQLRQAYDLNGVWHGVTVGGSLLSGAPALTYHDGRLDVFVTGSNGTLYQTYYDTVWHPFQALQLGWQPGVSAVWDGRAYHIFGHSTAGHLMQASLVGSSRFLDDLGGTTGGTPASTYTGGRFLVQSVSPTDHRLYQRVYSSHAWSAWQSVSPISTYSSQGAAAIWVDSALHVFTLSSAGSVQHTWYLGGWHGPAWVGGTYPGSLGLGYENGQVDLFAASAAGNLYELSYVDGGWTSWQQRA